MPTWMLTGATGFIGRHLLDAIERDPDPVRRLVLIGRRPPEGRPDHGWELDFQQADLLDPASIAEVIRETRPSVVLHAAGVTPPQPDPDAYFRGNPRATDAMLRALRDLGRPARVVLVGSAAELGPVPSDRLPIAEDCPCRPCDPYGLSKWAATRLGLATRAPIEVMVARLFNPIGPGLSTNQAFGRFAAELADPETKRLQVAGLATRRDFIDVRDAVQAIIAIARRGRAGSVYHVGSGESHSVGEGLADLICLSGHPVEVIEAGPGRGPDDSRADISRIAAETGWRPRTPFEQSLADLWESVAGTRRRPRLDPPHLGANDGRPWHIPPKTRPLNRF